MPPIEHEGDHRPEVLGEPGGDGHPGHLALQPDACAQDQCPCHLIFPTTSLQIEVLREGSKHLFLRNPSVQGTEVETVSAQITFFTLKTLFLGNFSTDFGFTDGFRKNVFGISPH